MFTVKYKDRFISRDGQKGGLQLLVCEMVYSCIIYLLSDYFPYEPL